MSAKPLPDSLLHAGAKVMKLSNRFIIFGESQDIEGLDWPAFKDVVAAHPPHTLTLAKFESTSITNHAGSVDDMAGKIARYLYDTFSLEGIDNAGLRAHITAAFECVGKAESAGFFGSSTYEAHGTSWEYRIVFAVPNPSNPDWFYSVVTTIKLTADIYEHKGLFGIGNESRHNFSADITGMELSVNKDYADS
ncbi:transporter [Ganoderma sinense ZZ0214-1]|uniref:Transporter n=1 Tax=Ganoderma sinense ZZ0214-1 TaxID=1077348 RepID=A0A2G8S578_9APHY|nr:transporter [Ganoderma sinense ZZ0214-1]